MGGIIHSIPDVCSTEARFILVLAFSMNSTARYSDEKTFLKFGFLRKLLYLCLKDFNLLNVESYDEGFVSGKVSDRGTGVGNKCIGDGDAVFGE